MTGDARRIETVAVTAGRPDGAGDPLSVPPVLASTFRSVGDDASGVGYARDGATATWRALEEAVGVLEGGRAVAFASGMAAVAAVLDAVPVGGRVVAPADCYGGVRGLLAEGAASGRWSVAVTDTTDVATTAVTARGAHLLWLESPSNPLLQVSDLGALAAAVRDAGTTVVVDSTFATPVLQRPLALGADVVVHSATKFLGGHSDLLLGLAVTADDDRREALVRRRTLAGATPGALESYLALRGLRTLPLRLRHGEASAGELARRLLDHPAVTRVRYPGLPGDPGHHRATAQMDGPGAVLSFEVDGGATAAAVCDAVRVVTSATSLGGVESTIERRAKLPGQEHVPAGLLRLSVGCEHVEDLWDDLDAALRLALRRS